MPGGEPFGVPAFAGMTEGGVDSRVLGNGGRRLWMEVGIAWQAGQPVSSSAATYFEGHFTMMFSLMNTPLGS